METNSLRADSSSRNDYGLQQGFYHKNPLSKKTDVKPHILDNDHFDVQKESRFIISRMSVEM